MEAKKRILTGIPPTGPLHLGHYAGALGRWRSNIFLEPIRERRARFAITEAFAAAHRSLCKRRCSEQCYHPQTMPILLEER
jgi:hypothetical protein